MSDSEEAIKSRIADLKREMRSLYQQLDKLKMGAWYKVHQERMKKQASKKNDELRLGMAVIKSIQSGKSVRVAAGENGITTEKARQLGERAWQHYDPDHYRAAIFARVGLVQGVKNFKAKLPV